MRQTHEDVFYKVREVFYENLLKISHLTHKRDLSGGFLHKGFNVGAGGYVLIQILLLFCVEVVVWFPVLF